MFLVFLISIDIKTDRLVFSQYFFMLLCHSMAALSQDVQANFTRAKHILTHIKKIKSAISSLPISAASAYLILSSNSGSFTI